MGILSDSTARADVKWWWGVLLYCMFREWLCWHMTVVKVEERGRGSRNGCWFVVVRVWGWKVDDIYVWQWYSNITDVLGEHDSSIGGWWEGSECAGEYGVVDMAVEREWSVCDNMRMIVCSSWRDGLSVLYYKVVMCLQVDIKKILLELS